MWSCSDGTLYHTDTRQEIALDICILYLKCFIFSSNILLRCVHFRERERERDESDHCTLEYCVTSCLYLRRHFTWWSLAVSMLGTVWLMLCYQSSALIANCWNNCVKDSHTRVMALHLTSCEIFVILEQKRNPHDSNTNKVKKNFSKNPLFRRKLQFYLHSPANAN